MLAACGGGSSSGELEAAQQRIAENEAEHAQGENPATTSTTGRGRLRRPPSRQPPRCRRLLLSRPVSLPKYPTPQQHQKRPEHRRFLTRFGWKPSHRASAMTVTCSTTGPMLMAIVATPDMKSSSQSRSSPWKRAMAAGQPVAYGFQPSTEQQQNPRSFDIDHLVPLAEAWDSGANGWSSSRREAFANDETSPLTLIAVSASSTDQKGDRDPAEWLPPAVGYRCEYVAGWVAVKARWELSIDPAEKTAIESVLSGCLNAAPQPATTPRPTTAPTTTVPPSTTSLTPTPTTTASPATAPLENPGDVMNCSDFATQAEAKPGSTGTSPHLEMWRDSTETKTVRRANPCLNRRFSRLHKEAALKARSRPSD